MTHRRCFLTVRLNAEILEVKMTITTLDFHSSVLLLSTQTTQNTEKYSLLHLNITRINLLNHFS